MEAQRAASHRQITPLANTPPQGGWRSARRTQIRGFVRTGRVPTRPINPRFRRDRPQMLPITAGLPRAKYTYSAHAREKRKRPESVVENQPGEAAPALPRPLDLRAPSGASIRTKRRSATNGPALCGAVRQSAPGAGLRHPTRLCLARCVNPHLAPLCAWLCRAASALLKAAVSCK